MTSLIEEMSRSAIEKAMQSILFSFIFPASNISIEQQIELKKIAKTHRYNSNIGLVIKASTNKETFLPKNTIDTIITTLAFVDLIDVKKIDQVLFQRYYNDDDKIELYIVEISK